MVSDDGTGATVTIPVEADFLYVYSTADGSYDTDPSAEFFFKFRLADKKIQLISGLAEYLRNLRNSAGIWLTNDEFC